MEKADITIIGAGIIGLAISAVLNQKNRTIYVLEKNPGFGQETSSRNSEVIHAGMYYPTGSLKARACVEGNRMTYAVCQENSIAYKKLGKLIVACRQEEIQQLEYLWQTGKANGAPGLEIINKRQIKKIEPNLTAIAALYSPSTGILDTHALMDHYFVKARSQGIEFTFNTEVIKISKRQEGYEIEIHDADGTVFSFFTTVLINCAGLNSDLLAQSVGIDIEESGYAINFCKGEYFRVRGYKSRLVKHLVYPVPEPGDVSLGIHATPDLGQGLRLGPDAQYILRTQKNYSVDDSKKERFCFDVNRFLPAITTEDLVADTAGIRPKLQSEHGVFRDFAICHEDQKGFPGLINLIGIDSPGLTCAPYIANLVKAIIKTIF